jgi:hypothetical protein
MYHFRICTYFEAHTLLGANCFLHHGHTMWSCLHEATKIQPLVSRLSRSGLLKPAWTQTYPADSCSQIQKSGVVFPINRDEVLCTVTAHEFVSVHSSIGSATRETGLETITCRLYNERLSLHRSRKSDIQMHVG